MSIPQNPENAQNEPLMMVPKIDRYLVSKLEERRIITRNDVDAIVGPISDYVAAYGSPRTDLQIQAADFSGETKVGEERTSFTTEMARSGVIYIDPNLTNSKQELRNTILHALGHALVLDQERLLDQDLRSGSGNVFGFKGFAILIKPENPFIDDQGVVHLEVKRELEEGVLDALAKGINKAYQSADWRYEAGMKITSHLIRQSGGEEARFEIAKMVQSSDVLRYMRLCLGREEGHEIAEFEFKEVLGWYERAFTIYDSFDAAIKRAKNPKKIKPNNYKAQFTDQIINRIDQIRSGKIQPGE